MSNVVAIFGAGGFAREVASIVKKQSKFNRDLQEIIFVDKDFVGELNGVRVVREDHFLSSVCAFKYIVAIADPKLRKCVFDRIDLSRGQPLDIISQRAEILEKVDYKSGLIACGNVTVGVNTSLGRGCHINVNTYVGHDCKIGDFVTFGPSSVCAGNVYIEDGVYIGAGALIRQGKPTEPIVIGKGSIIGMGSVVTCSVDSNDTVLGNPARSSN
ncbi:acetyltransferase [Amylibacter sp.]|nr:acetyltransferase [Amylibacter sp.]MDC1413556.1 acetyltransferase [Amylibacter sp.]